MNKIVKIAIIVPTTLVALFFIKYFIDENEREMEDKRKRAMRKEARKKRNKVPVYYDPPDEIWNDKESYSMARIQYRWHHPRVDRSEIRSIRIDGKDIRKAVSSDLLEKCGRGISYVPVRSPNGRYVGTGNGKEKYIIDIKNKTCKFLAKGGTWCSFLWTDDSKKLIFFNDGKILEHNVETGKTAQMEQPDHVGLVEAFKIRGQNKFFGIAPSAFVFFNSKWKRLSIVYFKEKIGSWAVSPRAKFVAARIAGDLAVIIKTTNPPQIILSVPIDDMERPVFGPKGEYIYYRKGYTKERQYLDFYKMNISTKKETLLYEDKEKRIGHKPTLYNFR